MLIQLFVCLYNRQNDGRDVILISDLPKGKIVGMMLVGDPAYYDPHPRDEDLYQYLIHTNVWARGTLVYKILEVVSLPIEFAKQCECRGQVGEFFLDERYLEKSILRLKYIQEALQEWKARYKQQIMEPDNPNEIRANGKKQTKYKGLSIKQPIVKAITLGVKRFENRSHVKIRLKGSELKTEDDPLKKYCKECPNNDPSQCRYVLHLGPTLLKKLKNDEKNGKKNKKNKKSRSKKKRNSSSNDNNNNLELSRNGSEMNSAQNNKPIRRKLNFGTQSKRTYNKRIEDLKKRANSKNKV